MTRVKICGIKSIKDLKCAIAEGADAVGFVVDVPKSHRSLPAEGARELISRVPVFMTSVAVIVPDSIEDAVRLADETGANILQIHGTFEPEELMTLRMLVPQKIVLGMPALAETEELARSFDETVDALLLDTYHEDKIGGTGKVHDWEISAGIAEKLNLPVILAGGLSPDNVAEAVGKVRPYAVDVSGGVETDGKKDCQKIASFIKAVRACQ
jgi:phosphoribosylanthranilate isomerase